MLKFLHQSLRLLCGFVRKVLLNEQKSLCLSSFHRLLKLEHLIADIIANLRSSIFVLEFFTTTEFQDALTLLVGALFFTAPLVVLGYLRKLD